MNTTLDNTSVNVLDETNETLLVDPTNDQYHEETNQLETKNNQKSRISLDGHCRKILIGIIGLLFIVVIGLIVVFILYQYSTTNVLRSEPTDQNNATTKSEFASMTTRKSRFFSTTTRKGRFVSTTASATFTPTHASEIIQQNRTHASNGLGLPRGKYVEKDFVVVSDD